MSEAEKIFKKANLLRVNNKIKDALLEYAKAKDQALSEGNQLLVVDVTHMIGITFSQAKKYPEAEENLLITQAEFKKLGNQMKVGATLRDRGSVASAQKKFSEARALLNQSIEVLKSTNFPGHLGISQVKLAMVNYDENQNIDEAEKLIKEGIENIDKSEDKYFESTACFDLAKVQAKLNKKEDAKVSLDKALDILNQISSEYEHTKRREEIKDLIEQLSASSY